MRRVAIGIQDFAKIREDNRFYIDKTSFIEEWWEQGDDVTLITRPRRFGKTITMSMLERFFSNQYTNQEQLFYGLSIWEKENYRKLAGTFPVIFLSFADVKKNSFKLAKQEIAINMYKLYLKYEYLLEKACFSEKDKYLFELIQMDLLKGAESEQVDIAIKTLSEFLEKYYEKKVLVFLDEYDTPMQEAYLGGYWSEMTQFIRSMFNSSFKTNPSLYRAVMTGVTRVSKESIFSDLNNLTVVTTTSNKYETSFGFTEEEVFSGMDELGIDAEQKKVVKDWYDGFTFGEHKDIYNPWSIINYFSEKRIAPYWAESSSNGLISKLIKNSNLEIKHEMEQLLHGECLEKSIDEQIIFQQLDEDEEAIWSLMLASGYLCVDSYSTHPRTLQKICQLKITNFETELMFEKMIRGWFGRTRSNYNEFVKALLSGNLKAMNYYMNKVALETISYFDAGKKPSEVNEPERFYHGFVLGLLVELREDYEVISNGESGLGRYDVMLIPRRPQDTKTPGIVLEFKVFDAEEEKDLKDTVAQALKQIQQMEYDIRLVERGVKEEEIRHYGFAFEGKKVLIG